ncbi:HAD family hydrolase [Vulcanisaeta thermophila]|uniref:HAD family hydrolase n=1 Tax=Vulcanisaeta thermophila TaxID=867917 RepID=UPI00085359A8|nr:HAD family hydrolase [Vulcanisaeta thermophila]
MLILIDLDGTLLPLDAWEPVFHRVSELIAREAGVPEAQVYAEAKALNRELMRRFDVRAFDWDYVFGEVARRYGVKLSPDVVESSLMEFVGGFRLFDGVFDILRLLREFNHEVAIATNGFSKYQSIVIRELGISKYISEIRTPDLIGCPKNCGEFFRGASAMIGDNPLFDVYYPSIYGLRTIFVGNWESRVKYVLDIWGIDLRGVRPDYMVSNTLELLDLLRRILPKGLI